jgi:replicative DNA helicase
MTRREMSVPRVPPQAIEAERSVLGSLLLDNRAFEHVSDLLSSSDFYRYEHQVIFAAIQKMVNSARPADVITIHELFNREGCDEEYASLAYLNSLAQFVSSANNIRHYAELVRDCSVLRALAQVGDEITSSAYQPGSTDTRLVLEAAERKILAIGERGSASRELAKSLSTEMPHFLDRLQEKADKPEVETGVRTGYVELDAQIGGFQDGDLIVIAGRPSMGKTSIAMNVVEHASIKQKLAVLVISLEMSVDQLLTRMIGSVGKIRQTNLRTVKLSGDDWTRIAEAGEKIHDTRVDVQEIGAETISQIRLAARRGARKYGGLGLIVVDYLQLLNGDDDDGGRSENRATEVAKISRGLKLLAKELRCPVIALSQLNRQVESRPDKRPMMSDLRESGSVEQDADVILFVYRDEVYTKEACREPGIAEVIIAKQRNGPIGTVRLRWLKEYTRFDNL